MLCLVHLRVYARCLVILIPMKTKLPTIAGIIVKYLVYVPGVILIGIGLLATPFAENGIAGGVALITLVVVTVLVLVTFDLLRYLPVLHLKNNRLNQIVSKLTPKSYKVGGLSNPKSPMFDALESGAEGGRVVFRLNGKEWAFMDYEFDKITHYKNGSFVSSHVYYSVMQITLPRKLPHIVLDSKHTRGKQMRFKFDSEQKISLEGNFDTYFDTYFPAHYEIDLLSIITPEVMEVLIQANQFDIEIYEGSLKLYSTMKSPEQVVRMMNVGFSIRSKLMNNIVTYSDSRLAVDSRKTVHTYGLTIQNNFRLEAFKLFLVAVAIIAFISTVFINGFDFTDNLELSLYMVAALVFAVGCLIGAIHTLKNGYKQRRERASMAYVDQTKP